MLKLCYHQVFPDNEVRKGQLTMELKKLRETQEHLTWPSDSNDLVVISWESFREQAKTRPLIVVAGFIHDVSDFLDEHPGGRHLLVKNIGKDATTAFFGGIYDHSNAAHNVCRNIILSYCLYLCNDSYSCCR
jgi:stearoyl-CoA desaturase (delta-9 desaturase)